MSTYRALKGYSIKSVSSDPSNPNEGQIWYNNSTGGLKIRPTVVAWASGGNMNNADSYGAGAGTQTAGLKMAGQGMSGLKNYKKDELKLSKAATKASANLKKERNQKKNEGSSKSSATKTRSDRIKTKSGAMLKRGSVGARRAENREKARERAKAMARKRLGK